MKCPQCGEKFGAGQEIFGRVVNTCICGCRVMTDAKKVEGPRMTEAEVLTRLLEYNGPICESIVAIEEMSEVIKEITKLMRGELNREHLAEEIADATIMLEQLRNMFNINDSVSSWMDYKVAELQRKVRK